MTVKMKVIMFLRFSRSGTKITIRPEGDDGVKHVTNLPRFLGRHLRNSTKQVNEEKKNKHQLETKLVLRLRLSFFFLFLKCMIKRSMD